MNDIKIELTVSEVDKLIEKHVRRNFIDTHNFQINDLYINYEDRDEEDVYVVFINGEVKDE